MASTSSYDKIAGMYHMLWADWYLPAAMPALEKLFFSRVLPGARVLDLCCGSGHVTKELVRRGYSVTGVDASAELITLARKDLPGVDLRVQDARSLRLELQFDAVLSTFDSLNHVLSIDELERVFGEVYRLVEPHGLFVFDMNLEEAYSADLHEWSVDVSDHSVGLVRGTYDPLSKTASTELIWFVRTTEDHLWQQHTSVVEQRCYQDTEILAAARRAGFNRIEAVTARDAGVTSQLGYGRVYFVARL